MTGALIAALNHLLKSADWARHRLQAYASRTARFDVPPFQFALTLDSEGYFIPSAHQEMATDVVIRLPAETPFLLLQGIDRVMATAHVEGNAEFATELSFVLRNLRWDIEEDLSRLIGDAAARRAVDGVDQFIAWNRQAADNLRINVADYLAHENGLLLTWGEFTMHRTALARLSADLDRVESRLNRL